MDNYSKRDIAKILDLPARTISYWTDFGLVIPDIQPSQGRGVARLYSERNLIEFGMINIMVKFMNVPLNTVQYILNNLRVGYDIEAAKSKEVSQHDWEIPWFDDFYTDGKWGTKKELLYLEKEDFSHFSFKKLVAKKTEDEKMLTKHKYFYVVDENFDINKIFYGVYDEDKRRSFPEVKRTMLWLGSIRDMAHMRLGKKIPDEIVIPF